MYGFDCFFARDGQTLSGTALTATTFGNAKRLFPPDLLMTKVRTNQQHTTPYSYEDVLEPGGWHLTFFGGVQRIQSKLASYSHRNIRRTFLSDQEGEQLGGNGPEAEKLSTLIAQKMANGDHIDDREEEKCSSVEFTDEESIRLMQTWDAVLSKVNQL